MENSNIADAKKIARQSRCYAEPLRFQSTENQEVWAEMPLPTRLCNPCLSTPSFATTFAKQEMEKNVIIILYFGRYLNCYYVRQLQILK